MEELVTALASGQVTALESGLVTASVLEWTERQTNCPVITEI
jgi:hypothetical protein